MTSKETHQYCNAFSLIIIGRGTDDGDLLNSDGEKFHTIEELTDQLTGIPTLNGKPKLFLIVGCVDGNQKYFFNYTVPSYYLSPMKLRGGIAFGHVYLSLRALDCAPLVQSPTQPLFCTGQHPVPVHGLDHGPNPSEHVETCSTWALLCRTLAHYPPANPNTSTSKCVQTYSLGSADCWEVSSWYFTEMALF